VRSPAGTLGWVTSDAERVAIERVQQRLSAQFPDVPAAVVGQVVNESYEWFVDHPTRDFVPVLVAEWARDRLRFIHYTA